MPDQSDLLAVAHEALERMRGRTTGLDGTDDSLWFVQGAPASIGRTERGSAATADLFAYAIYVAEILASTCHDVHVEIDTDEGRVAEASAVSDHGVRQFVLSWIVKCVQDPNADNIVFKYMGALRDLGQHDRAARLDDQLRQYAASGYRV